MPNFDKQNYFDLIIGINYLVKVEANYHANHGNFWNRKSAAMSSAISIKNALNALYNPEAGNQQNNPETKDQKLTNVAEAIKIMANKYDAIYDSFSETGDLKNTSPGYHILTNMIDALNNFSKDGNDLSQAIKNDLQEEDVIESLKEWNDFEVGFIMGNSLTNSDFIDNERKKEFGNVFEKNQAVLTGTGSARSRAFHGNSTEYDSFVRAYDSYDKGPSQAKLKTLQDAAGTYAAHIIGKKQLKDKSGNPLTVENLMAGKYSKEDLAGLRSSFTSFSDKGYQRFIAACEVLKMKPKTKSKSQNLNKNIEPEVNAN